MVKEGDVLGGRYRITGEIQSDTLAVIKSAIDESLQRKVAVKIMAQNTITEFYGSHTVVEREAQLAGRLEHPHVLPVYDWGRQDDFYFMITRYFNKTLYRHLKIDYKSGIQKSKLILDLLNAIAGAIDYIHEYSVIHANLKLANIVLDTQVKDRIYPYISDFGVAALEMQGVGTPLYMAPEQFTGNYQLSFLSDIYAFGIIVFECFTGETPFNVVGLSQLSLLRAKLDESVYSVRHLRPELPIGIDLVLKRLCAENPEDRYQTATEAVDDLYSVFYSGQGNIEGKVFISYARKDSEYVHDLAKELRRVGVDLWIDQDIEPGANWDDSIENALLACDMMLLIASPASLASEYVTHEWSYFMGGGKPVYPFLPKASALEKMHPRLARVQHVVGVGDMMTDIANIVNVLAGGNPIKLSGLTD